MSDYNEGDLVEAVKGETVIRGRLIRSALTTNRHIIEIPHLPTDQTPWIETYTNDGYTVTVIERAKSALPTEPGLFVRGDVPRQNAAVISLLGDGTWVRQDKIPADVEMLREWHQQGILTRLEPVAETAARFAARLHTVVQPKIESSWYTKSTAKAILKQADEIAADFEAES